MVLQDLLMQQKRIVNIKELLFYFFTDSSLYLMASFESVATSNALVLPVCDTSCPKAENKRVNCSMQSRYFCRNYPLIKKNVA